MMAATEEKHSGDGFGSPERAGLPAKPGAGQKRPEIGYRFMPNASMKKLTRANAKEKNPLAKLRLLACLLRKKGHSIRRICKEMVMPYSTVRDWLVRMQERGMGARFNRRHRGRKCKLPGSLFRTVRKWLNREPKKYGFESGSWQPSLILEMVRREFGIDCKMRTLRRKLHKIKFSYRKGRPVPHKTASRKEQEAFKMKAGERARELGGEGYAVFVEDEAAVGMSQGPGYGWRRTGGRDTVQTGFSKKSVKPFGIMGKDELYVRIADSTNSETFKEFMEDVRKSHPKFYMVLDNAHTTSHARSTSTWRAPAETSSGNSSRRTPRS